MSKCQKCLVHYHKPTIRPINSGKDEGILACNHCRTRNEQNTHLESLSDLQLFEILYRLLHDPAYFIPREYQTIGGMWTVDTYKRDLVTLQIMDEGYTRRIFTEQVCITENPSGLRFEKGNSQQLRWALELFDIPAPDSTQKLRLSWKDVFNGGHILHANIDYIWSIALKGNYPYFFLNNKFYKVTHKGYNELEVTIEVTECVQN